jgi:hypothetical protein
MVARWFKIINELPNDRRDQTGMFDFHPNIWQIRDKTMRRSKTLFFFFIFTLLFFQQQLLQQEANAQNLPSVDNLSSNQSPQNSGLPDTVVVYMMKLDANGAILNGDFCNHGDGAITGCVEAGSGLYPPPFDQYVTPKVSGTENPLEVNVDHYYLYNVLPREMNVAENDVTLVALKAQALAARSIADWKAYKRSPDDFKSIINSTDVQIFKPGSFENYNPAATGKIRQAVDETSGQYLYHDDGLVGDLHKLSMDAEFGSDAVDQTITEPVNSPKPYLMGVKDPISSTIDSNGNVLPDACKATPNGNIDVVGYEGLLMGMSQKGAIRWSRGNHCASASEGDIPWPVTWSDYRQILAHYYTGIDILDGSGSKFAPDDRWNLLNFNNNTPVSMNSGQPYTVSLHFAKYICLRLECQ